MLRPTHAVLFILFVLSGLPAGPARAEDSGVPAAIETIHAQDLARDIEVLASDAFEGREPGSAGEAKTLEYLEQAFRDAGVAPGASGTYLQPVPLVAVRRAGTPHFRISDPKGRIDFTFERDFVTRAGHPVETAKLAHLPVVFVGYGITASEEAWDDFAGAGVAGAAVLLLRGEPTVPGDSTRFKGRALTAHALPNEKYENAARHGARAAIVIHTDASAGYPWSVMTGGGLGSAQNFLADEGAATPSLELIVHVNEPAARLLLKRAGLDFDSLYAAAQRPGFRPLATPLQADMDYSASRRAITSHNVIAKVEGSGAPGECVIYTAHWDHVGRNDALPGDKIFNGAIDNATGTAGVLALARAFAALPKAPRRTVYFVATTAEEKGLLGSEYLARHPPQPLANIVGVLNMDAHFPFGPFDAMTVPGFGSSELEDVLAIAARHAGRVLQDDPAPEAGAYYRADHYSFARHGVPAIFAVGTPKNEELTPENPVTKRFDDYMRNGYHKPADQYDAATWDLSGVEQDVRVYFETGWRLAEDTRFPNWRYGNSFRALRDAMR